MLDLSDKLAKRAADLANQSRRANNSGLHKRSRDLAEAANSIRKQAMDLAKDARKMMKKD